jgi:peptide-methionine (R)-S-oxide reductase
MLRAGLPGRRGAGFEEDQMTTLDRRALLLGGTALAGAGVLGWMWRGVAPAHAVEGTFAVMHTDEEWRALLSPEAYTVLRHEGTEYPGTSPLLGEHRAGTFLCAGCDLALFDAGTKFESGTGLPSFYEPLPDGVGTSEASTLGMTRTEVHSSG